jgi:hypothetical protein
MFETHVSIYDSRGIYPKLTVLCDVIGYSYFKNIPLHLQVINLNDLSKLRRDPSKDILYASFLITRRDFPAYSFFPYGSASLIFKNNTMPDLAKVLAQAKSILRGNRSIPILYNPYRRGTNSEEARKKIDHIRSKPEYIDLFHCKRSPFSKQLDSWSKSFEFSNHRPSPLAVKRYFNMFSRSSRFIHIALHYFVTASRLIHNHFIEDGGLNLQLTVEALIRDFMEFHSIRNKRTAVQRFQDKVILPYAHMEFLGELYDARNIFLAHIDEDMYTDHQNIDDPDRYCYEHYESVAWLITRHIRYKHRTEP